MLSYRHAFHAGNHADVLKHLTLCLLLSRLNEKEKPYFYLDTHAACGIYALNGRFAAMHQEYLGGIARVLDCKDLYDLVPEYFSVLAKANGQQQVLNTSALRCYPGSPYFAATLTRPFDKLAFVELHSREFEDLSHNFRRDERISLHCRDGFEALGALLPPPIKRGLVFMDPSYELKSDYTAALKAVKAGLTRFNTGIFALWYPVLGRLRDHSKNLTQDLKRLRAPLLQVELRATAQREEHGMCGSGLLILNYPYQLYEKLEQCLNLLYPRLCDENGSARLRIINPQD